MNDFHKRYPTVAQSIWLSLRLILYSIVFGLVVAMVKSITNNHARPGHSLISLLGYLFPTILTIWWGFNKYRKTEADGIKLKFNKVPVKIFFVGIIMILTISFIVDPFSLFFPPTGFWKRMFEDMVDINIYTIIISVVAAPILEEILFRGIILDGLLKNNTPFTAILVSSILFGLVHLNVWQAIPAFFGGILVGYLYWKTNSIIPGMILHFANNFFCVLLAVKFTKMNWLIQLVGVSSYIVIFSFALIIFITGAFYLNNFFKRHPTTHDLEMESLIVPILNINPELEE